MADPKYANLPGIDLNSKDVFETSELPEDDQAIQKDGGAEEGDCVEKLPIDTKAAHKVFKGKVASSAGLDFSDTITKSRRTGYDVHQAEYEILEDGSSARETPQQKYQRLQHEIRELAEEVNKIKETVKDEKSTEKLSPVQMGKQLEYLQHQLVDLHIEKLIGPEASVDLSDPQGALRQRLMNQIDAYKPPQPAKNAPANQQGGPDHVTYELYYRPEQAQFSKNAKMANLEERLERLEASVGQNGDKMTLLTSDTDNKSMVGAVSVLNSKLSLLEQTNLEQIDIRLQSVLQKLSQIAEKKAATQEDVEKQRKVSELYELVKKWESVADSLPLVVDRLAALKELHEQALQFSQALTHMDTAQQEINTSLKAHTDMLTQLQNTFKQNTAAIKNNCDGLETRIKALKK